MSHTVRRFLLALLRSLEKYPTVKQLAVNLVYRFPQLDSKLRTAAHKVIHPEAVLDVTADRMPTGSRRAFERIRARQRP